MSFSYEEIVIKKGILFHGFEIKAEEEVQGEEIKSNDL